jgi:hypothetical protein
MQLSTDIVRRDLAGCCLSVSFQPVLTSSNPFWLVHRFFAQFDDILAGPLVLSLLVPIVFWLVQLVFD